MIGQTISHYRITAKLGAGGMGEVWLATDTKLDRQVALKFLPDALWNDAECQQRLIREAKAASQLDHPNVVTIHGIEEHEGRPFIVMAYVRGTTLDQYCKSARRTIDALIDLALQMADGLQYAHEAGVIHRDLKPGNILVDERGRVRILDFGIASLRGATRLTQTGTTLGTLAYAPPEVAQGRAAGPAADIYSLGVVLYQIITGQLPFEADHEAALLYSILHEPPKPFPDAGTEIPSSLQALILRCLEKQPENRYASCSELARELQRCRRAATPEIKPAADSERPSIAVLPFVNMSADPDNEYFSDGLSEELINVLAKNPGLKVTARTSAFAFKGKSVDLRDIGQTLGVETLLEGSVRKSGNRVRITTQLVKASDGFHVWSETYDRVLDDIFAVQDDIAQSVAAAMNVALLDKQKPVSPGNIESYNLVLRANHLSARITEDSLAAAVDLYQQALTIDPDDARAWAGLAAAYGTQAGYGHGDGAELVPKAKAAVEKALALDDTLAEAHEILGWLYLSFEFRWEEAGQAFRRGLAIAPGYGDALSGLATYEAVCGRLAEAGRLAQQAVALDPLNPRRRLFRARIESWSSRHDAARDSYAKALELSPGITSAHAGIATQYLLEGRLEEALTESMKEESSGYRSCSQAMIYHALGRKRESDEALAALVNEGPQWSYQIATVHACRGERDEAFAWLDQAYVHRDPGIQSVKVQHVFATLHDDPRWTRFLGRIGLTA